MNVNEEMRTELNASLARAQKMLDWSKTYEKRIMEFNHDFMPMNLHKPKDEGFYLTLRCGLTGVYQVLNQWKDGMWQMQVLDGSDTIAYSRERIQIPEF